MNNIKVDSKAKLSEEKYREMLEILQESQQITGQQLVINIKSGTLEQLNEIKELIHKKMDDPDVKHSLYYDGIQNILKKYLPQEKSFKPYRDIIHDEKNIFLNRGKAKDKSGRRGSDGRMDYNEGMAEMVDLVTNWVMESQDPIALWESLYRLNEKYNYGHQYYDKTSINFNNDMKRKS